MTTTSGACSGGQKQLLALCGMLALDPDVRSRRTRRATATRAPACDVHHCGADDYTGTYAVDPPDLVVITMDVRGPTKDYTTTWLTRR